MNEPNMIELLKDLKRDHNKVTETLHALKGEVLAEIRNLGKEIQALRQVDENLHHRIDKKDDRIRELEKQANVDGKRITALEATSKNNRVWMCIGFAAATAIGTLLAVFL